MSRTPRRLGLVLLLLGAPFALAGCGGPVFEDDIDAPRPFGEDKIWDQSRPWSDPISPCTILLDRPTVEEAARMRPGESFSVVFRLIVPGDGALPSGLSASLLVRTKARDNVQGSSGVSGGWLEEQSDE